MARYAWSQDRQILVVTLALGWHYLGQSNFSQKKRFWVNQKMFKAREPLRQMTQKWTVDCKWGMFHCRSRLMKGKPAGNGNRIHATSASTVSQWTQVANTCRATTLDWMLEYVSPRTCVTCVLFRLRQWYMVFGFHHAYSIFNPTWHSDAHVGGSNTDTGGRLSQTLLVYRWFKICNPIQLVIMAKHLPRKRPPSVEIHTKYHLVGGLGHKCHFSIKKGMSSSQLTKSNLFERVWTSTTN